MSDQGTTEDSSPTPPLPSPEPDPAPTPAPTPGEPPADPEPQTATAGSGAEEHLDASEAKRSERTLVRSLAALAVLFFLGTVAMGVVAASQHRKLTNTNNDADAARQVASRMGSALVTYDYRHLDQFKASVASRATGKFRNEFEQGFQGLDVFIARAQARSVGTVKNVYLDAIHDNGTTAVVVVDQAVDGLSGAKRRFDSYVELTLLKIGGTWKVDGVSYLNPATDGGATPTTAAPPQAPPK